MIIIAAGIRLCMKFIIQPVGQIDQNLIIREKPNLDG